MNAKSKSKILIGLHNAYLEALKEQNPDVKYKEMEDIFNLVKVVENYEEFIPDIQSILNKKAEKDKWNKEFKEK